MDILSATLSGLDQAQAQFGQSVKQLIQASSPSATGDAVDLSAAAVSLLTARNQFALDLNVFKIADDMQKSTINVLA